MPVVPDITNRMPATRANFKPIRDAIAGIPGYEVRHWHDHATEYGLSVRNDGAGPIAVFTNADGVNVLEITQDGVVFDGLTLDEAELTDPVITGGTITGVTFSSITLSTPTVTGGTWNSPALTGGSWGGSPIINGASISTPTISDPTITGALITGAVINPLTDGSFANPSLGWGALGDGQGFYRPATNVIGLATGDSTRTIKFGTGSGQISMIQVVQEAAGSNMAFYGTQGSFSTPVTPGVYPVVQADVMADMDGGFHAAIRGNARAMSGANGFVAGGQFYGYAWTGSWSSGSSPDGNGVMGISCGAESYADATGQHILTGIQCNVRGRRPNDIIHGLEVNLATLDDDPSTDPAHRVWLIMGTEKGTMSRRGTDIDAFMLLLRKKLTPDDTTNVRTIKNGIVLGDGGTTVENFPFDATSTFMVASSTSGTMGGFIDLSNVVIDDGSGADRGPIMRFGGGDGGPAFHIQSTRDGPSTTLAGWVGIGMTPVRPLSIKTSETGFMHLAGTIANFTTTSVGAAGGATALPATPVGYLRWNLNGTNYLLPYYTNA